MWDVVSGYVTHGDPDAVGPGGLPSPHELTLEDRYERLVLVMEAMWSLLRDHGYDDEDLRNKIRELDAADGVIDGRRTVKPRRCPRCDAVVEAGRSRCQICGQPIEVDDPFDLL